MNKLTVPILISLLLLLLAACDPKSPAPPSPSGSARLVVYCSADQSYFQPVFDAFTAKTGVAVDVLYDTEATKTFGLVQRLLNEKASPRADVFISSEPLGMIRLSRAGVLAPYTSLAAELEWAPSSSQALQPPAAASDIAAIDIAAGVHHWPQILRASELTWYGFALRQRVLVFNSSFVKPDEAPTSLSQLVDPRWKGRVGIARPHFGTTRAHLASVHHACPAGLIPWLTLLKQNDLRLFDGNSAVVRAVAAGEIHVGLTDSDDFHAGLVNDWPLGMVHIANLGVDACNPELKHAQRSAGPEQLPLSLPHTVGLIASARHPDTAHALIDFMLSSHVDELLAAGPAQTFTIFDPRRKKPDPWSEPNSKSGVSYPGFFNNPNYESLADHADPALKAFDTIFPNH